MNEITIRIIDPRTNTQFDYPLDADLSDRLLIGILRHINYQGDGNGAMAAAIDFWIQSSKDVLAAQIRTDKMAEAATEIEALRQELL